jgi:trigger factor
VERPAALGDQVVVDLAGTVDDKPIMNKENHEMRLEAGAKIPMPGIHEEIVGMVPGEDKTFTLTVPEDDQEQDVVGQEATINVHLHTVREEDVPALDDDLALMVGDYDSLDNLRLALREEMETAARQKVESEYLDHVLEAMIEVAKLEYPPQAIDREAEYSLKQTEDSLSSSGIELDRFLAMMGKTREAYKQDLWPAAEQRLRKRLVLGEIVKQEGLTVEESEVEAEVERLSGMMGERADEMREMLQNPAARLSVMDDVLVQKAEDRVTQIGKGEAPPLEAKTEVEVEVEAEAEIEVEAEAKADTEVEAEAGTEPGTETEMEAEAVEEAAGEVAGRGDSASSDSASSDSAGE